MEVVSTYSNKGNDKEIRISNVEWDELQQVNENPEQIDDDLKKASRVSMDLKQ